jgi:hypothetical protein
MSLTSITLTRSLGALPAPSDAASGVSNEQIKAAIPLGTADLRSLIGGAVYDAVLAFSSSDLLVATNKAKYNAYQMAESYLAIANLPSILSTAQLKQTGIVNQTDSGKATTRYATKDEIRGYYDRWREKAVLQLVGFSNNDVLDAAQKKIGFV